MNNMQFGFFAAAMGIAMSLAVLYTLGWIIRLLIKLCPRTPEEEQEDAQ